MKQSLIEKYKKEDNKLKGSSRKVTSFYSSLIAGLFVGTSFIFIIYFIPFGEHNWVWNWIKLSLAILTYCLIYYLIGISIVRGMSPSEVDGYKNNFLASFIGSAYVSIIILLKPSFWTTLVVTIILLVISYLIIHTIASRKYKRYKR
jgi:hypothetical protein